MFGKLMAILMVVCALALSASTVQASFFDNFDSYAPGSQMHGQGGWKGWDNSAGAGALVTNSTAFSVPNSVAINGSSDLVQEFVPTPTSGIWVFSCKQNIPAGIAGSSYLILMNRYTDGGPYSWSGQIKADMDVGQIVDDMAGGASLPMVRGQWVPLRFVIDLDANSVATYYNNQQLSSGQWFNPQDGVAAVKAVDFFGNNAGPVFYDDISLQPIPEPGSLGLLALGALGLLRRRR
ncbi:MAG: PEP-CTERM sorting domain-containing protein [Planctomycetota bacterium]|nr:PEP-CTERM sorting domain-containing protein [Planctomycetota bacterium]